MPQGVCATVFVLIGIRLPSDANAIHHDGYEKHGSRGMVIGLFANREKWSALPVTKRTRLPHNDTFSGLKRLLQGRCRFGAQFVSGIMSLLKRRHADTDAPFE